MEDKKILEVIAKISGKNIKDIELKDNLRVLGINSLETVELFLELEETFGITFDIPMKTMRLFLQQGERSYIQN